MDHLAWVERLSNEPSLLVKWSVSVTGSVEAGGGRGRHDQLCSPRSGSERM